MTLRTVVYLTQNHLLYLAQSNTLLGRKTPRVELVQGLMEDGLFPVIFHTLVENDELVRATIMLGPTTFAQADMPLQYFNRLPRVEIDDETGIEEHHNA